MVVGDQGIDVDVVAELPLVARVLVLPVDVQEVLLAESFSAELAATSPLGGDGGQG